MTEVLLSERLLQVQEQIIKNIRRRTHTILTGKSGSGKTTLLGTVSGLTPESVFLDLNALDEADLRFLESTITEAAAKVVLVDELAAVCNFPRLRGLPDFILAHSDLTWVAATPSLTTLTPRLAQFFPSKIELV